MTAQARIRPGGRRLAWILVALGLLLFIGANAHLVYVAFQSQPECVVHIKDNDGAGGYRAAKPAC